MASLGKTIYCICGGPLKPGQRACSRFCLVTVKNDEALKKHKTGSKKTKSKKKRKRKQAKR